MEAPRVPGADGGAPVTPVTRSTPLLRSEWAAIGLVAVIGLAIHGWFAAGADALDSDRALVLLMARHFAHGEFSLFFWQQNYMGALEPILLTPLALIGATTPVAASVVAIAVTAGLCAISAALARRIGGTAWVTVLIWAVPPAVVVHHHVSLYGARLTATMIAVGAFTLSLRAQSRRDWIVAGVLTGLAYFGDHLMLPWAAATIYVAARRGGESATAVRGASGASGASGRYSALRTLAIGAVPVVALDTIAAVLTPAFHLSGPNDPAVWLANIPLLFGTVIPQLFGFVLSRGPAPVFEPLPAIVPTDPQWMLFAATGALVIGAVAATLTTTRIGIAGGVAAGPADGARMAVRGLVVAGVVAVAIFLLTGGGGERWSVRYLVPLWPALSVLAAVAVARWPREWRPVAVLMVLPALFTLYADHTWPRGDDGVAARAEAAQVKAAVRRSGARAVWADYWDTYRMALLNGESPHWLALRIIERRPDWVREASSAERVAYLLRHDDKEMTDRLDDAASRNLVRAEAARIVGRYRLIVTDRPLPAMVVMNPAPERWWQRLAALTAGLLFLGMLAAGAVAVRFSGRR